MTQTIPLEKHFLDFHKIFSLQNYFEVEDNLDDVFAAAFNWYYQPKDEGRKAYASRVVDEAVKIRLETGQLPQWFLRVYELCINGDECNASAGVPPPIDPILKVPK